MMSRTELGEWALTAACMTSGPIEFSGTGYRSVRAARRPPDGLRRETLYAWWGRLLTQ
jgi:hypothetical protein